MGGSAGSPGARGLPVHVRSLVSLPSPRRVPGLSGCGRLLPAAVQSVLHARWLSADQCLSTGKLGSSAGSPNAPQSVRLRVTVSDQCLAAMVALVPRPERARTVREGVPRYDQHYIPGQQATAERRCRKPAATCRLHVAWRRQPDQEPPPRLIGQNRRQGEPTDSIMLEPSARIPRAKVRTPSVK
jgi:hypothetical protein